MKPPVHDGQTGSWTDEKHVRFLNSMEASFVRAMFENLGHGQLLRLDRHLPDTSDSTLDLKPQQRTKHRASDAVAGPNGNRMDGIAEKRSRRRSSRPYNPTQDQVVPQIENRAAGDRDERPS